VEGPRTRPEVIVCPSRRFLLAADNPNTETPTRAKKVIKKKKSPNHKETPRTPDDVITKTELEMVGVLVFGDNDSAQLALSSTTEGALEHDETILSPRPIPALSAGTHVRSVAFGTCHAAWLMADGGVFTVGDNGNGQCGVSAPAVLKTPQRLESLAAKYQAVQVSCGGAFTAVVTACGQLATFGANDHGQCGHGPEALLDVRKPKLVKSSVGDISMVACGEAHTLILDLSAAVHSCGNGRFGALGHGDMESVSSPALIRALVAAPICQVAAGERHSVALTFGGAVLGWGWGRNGALGLPQASLGGQPVVTVPRPLPTLRRGVMMIAAGGAHTLSLESRDGGTRLLGWGAGGSGGSPTDSFTPVELLCPQGTPASVVGLSAGRSHSLAVLADGRVLAWGQAHSGQLGLGSTVDARSPQLVPLPALPERNLTGNNGVHSVVAGGHSSAVLLRAPCSAEVAIPLARQPARLAPDMVNLLTASADWTALAALVGAVFSSPALVNASFADQSGAHPCLHGATLEQVYVLLLKTFAAAPTVLAALKDSMKKLIATVSTALHDETKKPPPLQRSGSSFGSLSLSAPHRAWHLLTPLVVLLQNPLLSHESEAAQLHALAKIIDEGLSAEQRSHLAQILTSTPTDIFAARIVRPTREALERALKLRQLASEPSALEPVVHLTRLLGLAREANLLIRQRAAGATGGDVSADLCTGGTERTGLSGGIADAEFYSPFLSEHLDLQHDYLTWMQHGPCERGGPDWRSRWSFCSEPWILTAQAKAQLLHIEAAIQMQQQVHQQVAMLRAGVRRLQDVDDLALPPKSRRLRSNFSARVTAPAASSGPRADAPPPPPPPPDPASPFLILRVRRAFLVDDALDALAHQSRRSLLRPLRVVFEGEPAIDEGGVRKEFFQELMHQLFNVDYGMFEWLDEPRVFWFSRASVDEAEFFLVGLVLGLAVYNGVILDLHFPPVLWQRVFNEPVGFAHLPQIQPDLCRGLSALLAYDGDVESAFCADFSVTTNALGALQVTELVPNGSEKPVTNSNRHEYVERYAAWWLIDSIRSQFEAFQKGFLLLCDGVAFSFLTPSELEELVCGTPHLDFQALEANARYCDGFHPNDPTIKFFWEVVHSMNISDKRALLLFATGCDRAPVGGLGKLQFVLQRAGPDAMDLPTSHTCFNMLSMPAYQSRAKLRDRLTIAIHNATGFGLQ